MTTNCGHCHTCGTKLRSVLDGEEWCNHCGAYRRYTSHGWAAAATVRGDNSPCPAPAATPAAEPEYTLLFDTAEGYHAEWVDDWRGNMGE